MSERAQVHYEVFARRTPTSSWALEAATESREKALADAEAMLAEARACSVRVSKETLDVETGSFNSVVILTRGLADNGRTEREKPPTVEAPCVTPADLYTVHARERIGRLLESWLVRQKATPFELLHRPDLAERLEATGSELQHAVQKIAIPEAQARGVTVHSVIRAYMPLVERALERLITDGRRGAFPDLSAEPFAKVCERIVAHPERGYRLGGAVAARLAQARDWSAKVDLLLDLAEQAPESGPARDLALSTLEQPLAEALASRVGVGDLLGAGLDLGGSLAALTRLVAGDIMDKLLLIEASLAPRFPPMTGAAERLSHWFERGAFESVRAALGRRILTELTGPRRLRPHDAAEEIDLLRALAMALTAAAGPVFHLEEVQNAFAERSRRLVAADFVEAFLGKDRSGLEEARALIWLAENVTGAANKRAAARWLLAVVSALPFETEMRSAPESPAHRLQLLAELQREIAGAGLTETDGQAAIRAIGEVGGWVESDAKLAAGLARVSAPAGTRIMMLLRMASGSTAPHGPAAERARSEAHKLLRQPAAQAELRADPDTLERIRALLGGVPLAA